MGEQVRIDRANTVLYCARWKECVAFFGETLGLTVEFQNEWFVEFRVAGDSFVSVADAARATIDPADGAGLTLSFRVADVAATRNSLAGRQVEVTPLQTRWGSTVFYCWDPEGHRIEFWQP